MASKKKVDTIYWIVFERKFLSAKAVSLHTTRDEAQEVADQLDRNSNTSFNKYVVQRVVLQ